MYQIIYDFINDYLIGSLSVNDGYASQLATILTHTSLILIYGVLVLLLIWVFKTVVNAFRF